MDHRIFDPKNQLQIAQALTGNSLIERATAVRLLQQNGIDVGQAKAAAKAWKDSGAKFVPMKPPPSPLSLKSAPHLPAEKVKDLLLQLANGSLVDKVEAKRFCAANNIPIDEMRALAAKIAGPAPNSGP